MLLLQTTSASSAFSLDKLSSLVALLITLSVAAQRLVELIKGLSSFLRTPQTDEKAENRRVKTLQWLAVGAGLATAAMAMVADVLPGLDKNKPEDWGKALLFGLLSSGGSEFWTSILGYVNGLKSIKQKEAVATDVKIKSEVLQAARQKAAHDAAVDMDRRSMTTQGANEYTQASLPKYLLDAQLNLEQAITAANSHLRCNS